LTRVDYDGRGFWEKLKNFSNGWGWRSNEEVQQLEDKWRNWLRQEEAENGGNLIDGCPDHCHKVNIDSLNRNEVFHYAASLKEALEKGNVKRYSQEEVNRMEGVTPPIPPPVVLNINFGTKQLQKKFKHAADFGVKENYSPENAQKFQEAMENHMTDPTTKVINGTYHGTPVTHYVNPNTGLNVMEDAAGNFLSGWKLSPTQLWHVLTTGKL
jgi:hypothetical protein